MKAKNLLSIIAIAFITLLSGCADDNYMDNTGVYPVASITTPANDAINAPLDQVIDVTFNVEVNPATVNQLSFTLQQGTTPVAGTITYSGKTATFTPSAALKNNATYTAKLTTSIKGLDGNPLQQDYVWTFSTGSSITPMVLSTDPAKNATAVFLNKVISADFNMAMNESTINTTTFTVKKGTTAVSGTVSYNGTTATFTPNSPLAMNTIYTATITTAVKNIQGTTITAPYVWTFTTGSVSGPMVLSTDPINNAIGVATNKVVRVTFDMPMDLLTLNGTNFTLKAGTSTVLGTVTHNTTGDIAYFTPNGGNLLANTTYTATITNAVKNAAGVPLANNYVWSFNTNAPVTGSVVNLGFAARFGILAGVGVSNNAGFSEIRNMDVGISPGVRSSITGFPPAIIVNGAMYASDDIAPAGTPAMLTQAKLDLTNAYLFVEGASYSAPITVAGDQGGKTLVAGIYKSTSTLMVQKGDLTLSGSATDVWIFQVASAFTTVGGAGGNIILSGGALAKNVYWQTGSSATIGDYTKFNGNILALQSITMGSHSTATGRMLARNGSIVMTHTNIITKP